MKRNYLQLEKDGIITGATTHINYKFFGYKAVAYILITVDPQQASKLCDYLAKMPDLYGFFGRGIEGNIDVITTLKTLEQLSDVKDAIKRNFSVQEMRTAIWTDVKEMNQNLSIVDEFRDSAAASNIQEATAAVSNKKSFALDKIDQKIANKLAEDGRLSMDALGKSVGISAQAAKRRYQRLKDSGALKITIQISPVKLGYQAICIFFASTSSEKSPTTIQKISAIPDIISIMKTAGDYDLQIYAMVQNIDQLLSVKEKIEKTSGIRKIDLELNRIGESLSKWPSPRQYISTF